jgi:hypothetical protein
MTGNGVRLFIRDGKLANSRGGDMVAISDNKFILGPNRVEAYPSKLLFITPSDSVTYMAIDSARSDPDYLNEYIGEYVSDEAETKLTVMIRNGKLVAHRDPATDIPLQPSYKDGFTYPGGNVVVVRDKKKNIIGLGVYTGRASNVAFMKVK